VRFPSGVSVQREALVVQVTISKRLAIILLVLVALLVPAAAFAGSIFADVDDNNVHIDGIEWVRNNGVTQGCTATQYCPKEKVSREQMASFLYRLSGNDPLTAPSVNAARLAGKPASAYAGAPTLTRLHYTGQDTKSVTAQYQKIRTVGSFNKDTSGSDLLLMWNGHGGASGDVDNRFCEFQLRIDNRNDQNQTSTNFNLETGSSAVLFAANSPIGITGMFRDVGAGNHTVSIWARGTDNTTCRLNTRNFGQDVFVHEVAGKKGTAQVSSGGVVDEFVGGYPAG
jgi:hypothetical protein